MWKSKNRLLAILSAFLILMACFGIGIVAAEETTDSGSTDSGSADDSSSSDASVDDSSSDNSDSVSDTSSDDSSGDTSSDDTSSDDASEESADDSSEDESTSDETSEETSDENADESGVVVYEEDSNDADDGSTIVEIEETTTVSDDDITVTDITTISDDDVDISDGDYNYTVYGDDTDISTCGPVIYDTSDNDYNYTSDDDYTYSDDDNITTTINLEDDDIFADNSTINTGETIITETTINQVILNDSKTVSVNIENNNSVVNNVYFVPTKDAGKAKVIVEDLKPECIKKKPVGVVYKSFNIFIDNPKATVENAAVDFKVEKTWLIENDLDSLTIILNMYEGGKWIEVPVTITGEDSRYVYFKAEVSEYSTFAITSKTITVDKVMKQDNSEDNPEEEIDEPTKNVIVKLLELVIELLE